MSIKLWQEKRCAICKRKYQSYLRAKAQSGHGRRGFHSLRPATSKTCGTHCSREYQARASGGDLTKPSKFWRQKYGIQISIDTKRLYLTKEAEI